MTYNNQMKGLLICPVPSISLWREEKELLDVMETGYLFRYGDRK